MTKLIWVLLFCLFALPGFAQSASEALPKFEIVGNQVRARDSGTSEIIWENTYPSVRLKKGDAMFPMVGPLLQANQLFYAVRGDLFAVDPLSGVVERRQMYPAIIQNLIATDSGMDLELKLHENKKSHLKIAYHPHAKMGPPMPSFLWVPGRAIYDATQGRNLFDVIRLKGKDRDDELKRILNDEKQDPTNPFLPLLRGLLSGQEGPNASSNAAIEQAILRSTTWIEKLEVAQLLDFVGRREMSDQLYAAAKADLRENGGDFDTITSVLAVVYVTILLDSIKEAVDSGDLERTDFLANRLFELYPSIEFRGMTWMALSRWFADRGDDLRSKKWSVRGIDALFQEQNVRDASLADLWLHISLMIPFVLILMALLIGVRPSFPKPRKSEIAMFIMLGAVACLTFFLGFRRVETIKFLNEQPDDFALGSTSSPAAVEWLETLTPSPEREALIVRAKQAQGRLGTDVAPEALDRQQLEVARLQTATARTWKAAGQIVAEFVLTSGRSTGLALWVVLAMALGVVMRKRSQKARQRFLFLIPGSHCGPVAPLIQSLFVFGILLCTSVSIADASLTSGSFARHLGLPEGVDLLSRTKIGFAFIGAALMIHIMTSLFAWRKEARTAN